MNSQKKIIIASVVLLIGIFSGLAYLFNKNKQMQVEQAAAQNSDVFVRSHSPILGSNEAKVTVVEFMDPECESCREFYPHIKHIMRKYEGKARLVIRYVPFHQNSRFAIAILEASKLQGKYWETLELLFKTQPEWGDHHNPKPELLWNYLPEVGLNIEQLKKDMQNPEIAALIETDFNDAKTLQIRGTPSFFVNGKMVMDFGTSYLEEAIDQALLAN
jgi:protein-disulfide isomerase